MTPQEALKLYFGYDRFLDYQEEIVELILSGKDIGVIMPTGAGKSLCYQLPALMKNRYSSLLPSFTLILRLHLLLPGTRCTAKR